MSGGEIETDSFFVILFIFLCVGGDGQDIYEGGIISLMPSKGGLERLMLGRYAKNDTRSKFSVKKISAF